jgi:molybdate transport system substrate-binding protein
MRARDLAFATGATLILLTAGVAAAEIRVLSVGAVQNGLRSLAADFSKDTGHQVTLTIGSPAVVTQKIKEGFVADAVIVSEPAMDALDKEGIANPESRVRLVATGLGVAVREGAPVPDVSTPEAFKQALTTAKSIAYGDPTLPNQSGEKAEKVLARAGLLDTVKPKVKIIPSQADSQAMIAKGEIEMGLYNVSEIPEGKGLKYAGPAPAPLQVMVTYEAALMSDGSVPEAARAFITFLASDEAQAKWRAARLDPPGR